MKKAFEDTITDELEKALSEKLPTPKEIEAEEKEDEIESPELEDDETPVEKIVDSKPTKEQLMKLSKSGFRFYQRTGKLPQ